MPGFHAGVSVWLYGRNDRWTGQSIVAGYIGLPEQRLTEMLEDKLDKVNFFFWRDLGKKQWVEKYGHSSAPKCTLDAHFRCLLRYIMLAGT